jgi:hypothetical protein
MPQYKSASGVRSRTVAYEDFQGLDTSRDSVSMDTGRGQHFDMLVNGTCDWRGQIVRDPAQLYRGGTRLVTHARFFAPNEIVYVERTLGGLNLVSERDHRLDGVYFPNSIVTSTVFNRKVQIVSKGQPSYSYDGAVYRRNQSNAMNAMLPAYCTAVNRRMAVAGIAGRETQVHISRVDGEEMWPDDEEPGSVDVLRAGYIDVANLLGTAGTVTGLGSFEQDRLIVFTEDRGFLFRINPDIKLWRMEERTNIQIGCVSHNTICNAGTDVLFCSRSGIHSITRSVDNGVLVYSTSLSDKIDLLYRELLDGVGDPQEISAVFDQDRAQYHVFFPQQGGVIVKRLTMSMNPEGGEPQMKFSTGTHLNARCGTFLGGKLIFGTPSGIYEVMQDGSKNTDAVTPDLDVTTPMLWHGSVTDMKETMSIVLQVAGKGILDIEAWDDEGRKLGSMVVEATNDPDDGYYYSVPLSRQYERKWQHRYRGAQYRIRSRGGSGLLRLIGLAVQIKVE